MYSQNIDEESRWDDFTRMFSDFLQTTESQNSIQKVISQNETRFSLNLDRIRVLDSGLADMLIQQPIRCLRSFQPRLQMVCDDMRSSHEGMGDSVSKKKMFGNVIRKNPQYKLSFEGNLGRNLITPRGLNASMVNKLVAVQGIVTRMSIVRPKLIKSVHYCDATEVASMREYNDEFNLAQEPNYKTSNVFPLYDPEGKPLSTEFGYCTYKDHQTLLVQEMPEKAPTGLLPRSVEIILEEDLVDKTKPGDRVQITGVYKSLSGEKTGLNGIFKCVIVATNVSVLNKEIKSPVLNVEDMKNITKIAKRKDLFDLMSRSIAPSIQGHPYIKKAILLMLLGGVEKNLENGTHLRGDINILVIGDPSTAKSQLLRHVMNIAPLAISTTGRGSSGVGLTAAVTFDRDTGERHLEAGAMVLADRGIVCIDEFDKMDDADRVAIHEVMEQQTVTIAKAGIHTSLNSRCSVIAAANPIYGEYQKDLPPTRNIGLPDSLLSRFDLLFIVLDEKNPQSDRLVAERVTRNHRFRAANWEDQLGSIEHDGHFIIEPEDREATVTNEVFEKFNATIHNKTYEKELLTQSFLKKYIGYSKERIVPVLQEEAIDYITNVWTKLRQRDSETANATGARNLPITIRTLETLIRIATAHAKLRLSKVIEEQDCKVAVGLLNYALFNEKNEGGEDDDSDEDNDGDDYQGGKKRSIRRRVFDGDYKYQKGKSPGNSGKVSQEDEKRVTRSHKKDFMEEEQEPEVMIIEKKSEKKIPHEVSQKSSVTEKDALATTPKPPADSERYPTRKLKKKLKIAEDAEEDVLEVIEKNIRATFEVTMENKKFIYKILNEQLGNNKKPFLKIDALWELIKNSNEKGGLDSIDHMTKCVMQLHDEDKLMYQTKEKTIYWM